MCTASTGLGSKPEPDHCIEGHENDAFLSPMHRHREFVEDISRPGKMRVSVVIPAHNEAGSVGDVVQCCKPYCDEVIVVDDGSTDNSSTIAELAGAKVIRNRMNLGIVESMKIGFEAASGDIIVTLDADGQHDPAEIPNLVRPLICGTADLVLGKRDKPAPISEQLISGLVRLSVNCHDVGTGYRALTRDLARRIDFWGFCACGGIVLESHKHHARIVEVPIRIQPRRSGRSYWSTRSRTTTHCKQSALVLFHMIKWRCETIMKTPQVLRRPRREKQFDGELQASRP